MKKFFSCFNKGSLVLFIFGILIICLSAVDMFTSLKPAVSFQDIIDGEEVKEGTHVAGNVVYAMDYFASESSYTKYSDGSRSGSKKIRKLLSDSYSHRLHRIKEPGGGCICIE